MKKVLFSAIIQNHGKATSEGLNQILVAPSKKAYSGTGKDALEREKRLVGWGKLSRGRLRKQDIFLYPVCNSLPHNAVVAYDSATQAEGV